MEEREGYVVVSRKHSVPIPDNDIGKLHTFPAPSGVRSPGEVTVISDRCDGEGVECLLDGGDFRALCRGVRSRTHSYNDRAYKRKSLRSMYD